MAFGAFLIGWWVVDTLFIAHFGENNACPTLVAAHFFEKIALNAVEAA